MRVVKIPTYIVGAVEVFRIRFADLLKILQARQVNNSVGTHARAIASKFADQLTVMEPTTWQKLNKLSKIV